MTDNRHPVVWVVIILILVGLVIAVAWMSEVAGNDEIFPAELGDMKLMSDENKVDISDGALVGTDLDTINTSKRYVATYVGHQGILFVNIAEMESHHIAYTVLEELKTQIEARTGSKLRYESIEGLMSPRVYSVSGDAVMQYYYVKKNRIILIEASGGSIDYHIGLVKEAIMYI